MLPEKRASIGVVCGHIHEAEILRRGGMVYCNDGDWVESCTALVEDADGALKLLSWTEATALEPVIARKTA